MFYFNTFIVVQIYSIENSYGGGEGVQVTNTGSQTLWFKTGTLGFILDVGDTRTLDTSTNTYAVKASDDYTTTEKKDGRPPTQDQEAKMTTIATINYPSNTSFSIAGGDTLDGAKFKAEVKMIDK